MTELLIFRGYSRIQAAQYVGFGVTKFDEMVKEGKMPPPRTHGSRKVWDRIELDEAFSNLPHDGEENGWDKRFA